MTEQEAETLAERLTRIWSPRVSEIALYPTRDGMLWVHGQILGGRGRFSFCRNLTDGAERVLLTRHSEEGAENGRLDWNSPDAGLRFHSYFYNGDDSSEKERTFIEFARVWMPFFRRGCWLSGCDIEATAHEKAEWIQGFSREELEAWNLKM